VCARLRDGWEKSGSELRPSEAGVFILTVTIMYLIIKNIITLIFNPNADCTSGQWFTVMWDNNIIQVL